MPLCLIDEGPTGVEDTTVQQDSGMLLTGSGLPAAQFEPTKLFFHADRVLAWLEGETPAPITLELDLTLSCNDRCPFCPHGFAHQKRHLSTDHIRRVLEDAARVGIRGLTITGGGEPMMHPAFQEVMRLIRLHSFSAGIITNGGIVNASLADEMVATFKWIRVSLDAATETTFERVRGHRGLQHRLAHLALLTEAKRKSEHSDCELGTSFLTSSDVASELVEAASLSRTLGFDYIQFKPMVRWLGINKHRSPLMGQSGVVHAMEAASEFQNKDFQVLLTKHRYEADFYCLDRSYSALHSAWFVASVGPNMLGEQVVPTLYLDCSSKYVPRWTIGEFESLETILQSDRRKQVIASASSDTYCIPSEKHAVYSALLDSVLRGHRDQPLSMGEIRALSPQVVKHSFSL